MSELTNKEKKQLKQKVTKVRPDNIFTWYLNQHTVFEEETDRKAIADGEYNRRVGVTGNWRLTEKQIRQQEDRLGIHLPEPWRDVYKHFNGGWVDSLFWGDLNNPQIDDLEPIPQHSHEFLALEDVGPLAELLPKEMDGLDGTRLDPRLIAIACSNYQAVVLDYRHGDDPKVCCAFFDEYDDDPLAGWEEDEFTTWWPNMQTYFDGLYLQDRII